MRSLTQLVHTVENLWQMLLSTRELAISEASDCEQDNATKRFLMPAIQCKLLKASNQLYKSS